MIVDLFLKFFHQIGKSISYKNFLNKFFFSSHLLQADSQTLCDQWINSLQLAISNSFKSPNGGIQNSASVCILK
jgi:hypothetical protein